MVVTHKKRTGTLGTRVAVVLVRGLADVSQEVKDTLRMMNLHRKNNCVVLPLNTVFQGMITKVKDFVTWGEITDETFQGLVKKRGELYKGRLQDARKKYAYAVLRVEGKHYKPYFRLNPPHKGFGRKGIKIAFPAGGALGYRADKINDLLERMM